MTVKAFKGAPWWEARFEQIGTEKMPLLLIDNFYPNPATLINDAGERVFLANASYYPGVRANIQGAYFNPLMKGLSEALVSFFNYDTGVSLQECFYSLVTTRGKDLGMVQRVPHVDGGNDRKVAILHYLCGAKHGGTSFYKQSRTGFETVRNARYKDFNAALEEDYKDLGPSAPEYYTGKDQRFISIFKVEAKFNRAIIYFGCSLHSIDVDPDEMLIDDPKSGRLTVNTFLNPL